MSIRGILKLSKRVGVFFAGADADRRFERIDENLAVADLAGSRRRRNGLDHLIDHAGSHGDLDLKLGQKAHRIFGAAINFRMPLLTPVTLDLSHRQSVHADGGQSVAHLLELERLDDRHHYFHVPHPSLANRRAPKAPRPARWRLGAPKEPARLSAFLTSPVPKASQSAKP